MDREDRENWLCLIADFDVIRYTQLCCSGNLRIVIIDGGAYDLRVVSVVSNGS